MNTFPSSSVAPATITRRTFISSSVVAVVTAPRVFARAPQPPMPSYLKGYELLWTKDPKAANEKWFREARLGLFMHYGVSAVAASHVWSMYGIDYDAEGRRGQRAPIPIAEYEKWAEKFTADKFDANFITDLALEAGCRYVNITTRHHDGFCLWDSASEPFNARNSAAKRDLVKELSDACAKKSLGFLPYWSLGRDWRCPYAFPDQRPPYEKYFGKPDPHYPPWSDRHPEKYMAFAREQVTELLTKYKLAGLWFDGVGVGKQHKSEMKLHEFYDYVHRLQPSALVAHKNGVTGTEDFIACEGMIGGAAGDEAFATLMKRNVPRETCSNLGKGWGYSAKFADKTISFEHAWKQLRRCTAQSANWLANTGPLPDGSIDPSHVAIYRALGEKIRREGFPPMSGPQYDEDRKEMAGIVKLKATRKTGFQETP
ncbi:MAG: alpha-L-fucosidase precursor [Opitutia bacterium]|nr:MAG: alpha-L-fucosidase precursor [Opitutae bacterium]